MGFGTRIGCLPAMRRPLKASVAKVGRDAVAHLSVGQGTRATPMDRPVFSTLCGESPAWIISGLPTAQPQDARCRSCYEQVDGYGYPKE